MKYIILAIGYLIIKIIYNDEYSKENSIDFMGGIGPLIPLFLYLIWSIVWLILFFVFDLKININICG